MEYKKAYVNDSIFGFPCKLSVLPELPMIEYKAGKWKIKITDLRYLNEQAVSAFEQCVLVAAHQEDATEASFLIGDISEDKQQLITDICMAIKFEAKKRGGDCIGGNLLITGVERHDNVITFKFIKDMARIIYDYAQEKSNKTGEIQISLTELVAQIVEKHWTEMREYIQKLKV